MNKPQYNRHDEVWKCFQCARRLARVVNANNSTFPDEIRGRCCLELPAGFEKRNGTWQHSDRKGKDRSGIREMLRDMPDTTFSRDLRAALSGPRGALTENGLEMVKDFESAPPRLRVSDFPADVKCQHCRKINRISTLRGV
jgi:hypothetical protein